MAKSKKSKLPVWQPRAFKPGNQAAAIPYDQKRIRDELKYNLYKACNFLNMTATQAREFVLEMKAAQESGIETKITVFEALIVDAIESRRWDLIDRILDRIFPRSIPLDPGDSTNPTVLDEISREQKERAILSAQRAMAVGE